MCARTACAWRIANLPEIPRVFALLLEYGSARSRDPFHHLLTTAARLATRGGLRSVVAESVLLKHQLLILNRSRQRAPHLRLSDRLVAGWCALLIRPSPLIRSAIVLKPSTLLRLHQALRNRKYRRLFSSQQR